MMIAELASAIILATRKLRYRGRSSFRLACERLQRQDGFICSKVSNMTLYFDLFLPASDLEIYVKYINVKFNDRELIYDSHSPSAIVNLPSKVIKQLRIIFPSSNTQFIKQHPAFLEKSLIKELSPI